MGINSVKVQLDNNWYNAEFDSATGEFSIELTSPPKTSFLQPGGYYGLTLAVGTTEAFTQTFTDLIELVVQERVAPVITVTNVPDGTFMRPNEFLEVEFNVADEPDGSGVDSSTISATELAEDGSSRVLDVAVTPSGSFNGYICKVTVDNPAFMCYNIDIKARDFDGNLSAPSGLTLYHNRLIYDRAAQDVSATALKEARYSQWPHKGTYDNRDVNRIAGAMKYLEHLFALRNEYPSVPVVTRTDYAEHEVGAWYDTMDRLLQEAQALKNIWTFIPDVPIIPATMEKMTWQKANDLEYALRVIIDYISRIVPAVFYAGEIYAGEWT